MAPSVAPRFTTVGDFAAPADFNPGHLYVLSFTCHHGALGSHAEALTAIGVYDFLCGDVVTTGHGMGVVINYSIVVVDENANVVTSCSGFTTTTGTIKCGGGKYSAELIIKDLGTG
jgi:hypothetical protein